MAEELTIHFKQAAITPFWKKFPFFFLFPFRFGPLVFMVCIVAASALAGMLFGGIGMAFKGFLVYLGLRYSFNVLELFAKGRFEGHSVDHTLWGPEKRPAKLGLVITLFIVLGISLGNYVLDKRIAKDSTVQQQIVDRYKVVHAQELEALRKEQEAFDRRIGLAPVPVPGAVQDSPSVDDEAGADNAVPSTMDASPADISPELRPDSGPSRERMIEDGKPEFSDPLWFRLQPAWYWLLMLLLSLMLPSAAIVIALEDRFFKALNPTLVVYFIQSIGSAYFALWAFFLSIAGARQFALSIGQNWPMALRFPTEMALATYLALVLFAMMGYALYQFHQELGLDVDVDFDDHRQAGGAEAIARAGSAHAALREVAPADPLERKVQALLKEGKVKEAIAEVKDNMRYDRFDADLNTRLHALLVQDGDPVATLAHGQQWLSALARAQQGKNALAAWRTLLQLDPEFVVADGDVILPAAQAAVQSRDVSTAVQLLKGFDKRFPQHKDLPAVLFLGAKLMSEHMRQHDKAAVLLRSVLARFPDHAVAEEARTYLSVLETVAAKTATRA